MATTNRPNVEERRAAAEQALERELTRIVESGEYSDWFRHMSQFHRYSTGGVGMSQPRECSGEG